MKNTVSGHQPFVVFDQVCKYYQMGDTRIAAADHVSFHHRKGRVLCDFWGLRAPEKPRC